MPDEQLQMQGQAPSGQDLGSVASALLPGVLSLLLGGPAMAAGTYAAEGERQKYEREQAMKERRQAAEEQHWAALNKEAQQLANYREAEMGKINAELAGAQKSDQAFERWASKLPEDQRDAVLGFPRARREQFLEKYIQGKLDPIDRAGASALLQKHLAMSQEDADNMAARMKPDEVRDLPSQIIKAKLNRQPYTRVDEETGALVQRLPDGTIVRTPDFVTPRPKTATDLTPAQIGTVERSLRSQWMKNNATSADILAADPEEIDQQYEAWRQSSVGQAAFERAGGLTAQGKAEPAPVPPPDIKKLATALMKSRYLKAGPKQTEEGFDKYLQSDEGQKGLEAYKDYVAEQKGISLAPKEHPVEMAPKEKPATTGRAKTFNELLKKRLGQ